MNYYYMSVGEKTYYYTLNYCYTDLVHENVPTANGIAHVARTIVRHTYIRNLSHDFDQAISRLKELERELNLENVKYMSSPCDMNPREKGIIEARNKAIAAEIITSGKYYGYHVKDVPEDYIIWTIVNRYNPESTNETVHICYNYADKKGLLKDWILQGKESHKNKQENNVTRINNALLNETILIGKFKGKTFNEVAYTKKGTINKNFLGYYDFLNQSISIRGIAGDFNDDETSFIFTDANIDNSQLTLIVLRNAFYNRNIKGNYKYEYKNTSNNFENDIISDIDAIRIYFKTTHQSLKKLYDLI